MKRSHSIAIKSTFIFRNLSLVHSYKLQRAAALDAKMTKSPGEEMMQHRMTRAWLVSTVQTEWSLRFLAEQLPNMEHIYTVWNVKREHFPILTIKDNASHAPSVQPVARSHEIALAPRTRNVALVVMGITTVRSSLIVCRVLSAAGTEEINSRINAKPRVYQDTATANPGTSLAAKRLGRQAKWKWSQARQLGDQIKELRRKAAATTPWQQQQQQPKKKQHHFHPQQKSVSLARWPDIKTRVPTLSTLLQLSCQNELLQSHTLMAKAV